MFMDHTLDERTMKWDRKFLDACDHFRQWSKDRSRQVAAVVVGENKRILSVGYNGFPRGCNDEVEERHERPEKYFWTEHAERNAIYNAAAEGVSLKGATFYIKPLFPCVDCARGIIQVGAARLVTMKPDFDDPTYGESFRRSAEMMREAGLRISLVEN